MRMSSRGLRGTAMALIATSISTNVYAGQCGFQPAFDRPDEGGSVTVKVFQGSAVPALGGARPLLFIVGSLKVNTDGAKVSYNQNDPTGLRCQSSPGAASCAINNVRNAFRDHHRPVSDFEAVRDAGYPLPKTWQVLSQKIIEKNKITGKPCISADGYLVSMTADVAVAGGFAKEGDCDQAKWIDALTVPALVIPGNEENLPSQFLSLGVAKRSLVIAASRSATKRVVSGIVGDIGPGRELGEASVAMNRTLNGLPDTEQPKHRDDAKERFQAGRTAVVLFPGSSSVLARPITGARVAAAGADILAKFGGAEKLYGCIKDEIDPAF